MNSATKVIIGDALNVLEQFTDNCIDCCVTSPPYFSLRNYGVNGQIGLEEDPQEYINKLVKVFREVRRTLRPEGTLWLNIGDSYAGSGKGRNKDGFFNEKALNIQSCRQRKSCITKTAVSQETKRKDLIGIPWLLALALRGDGWYLRQDIIWYKPNCMPESVTDRCTKSHEYIFLLSKSEKYYFDYEAIQEPAVGFNNIPPAGSSGTLTPNSRRRKGNAKTFRGGGAYTCGKSFDNNTNAERESHGNTLNETGFRRKRSVWSVSTVGSKTAHFATFPEKLIEPCILAGCPSGGMVLDPFLGSGTTAISALKNGRNCIGIELNPEYAEIAKQRIRENKNTEVKHNGLHTI